VKEYQNMHWRNITIFNAGLVGSKDTNKESARDASELERSST